MHIPTIKFEFPDKCPDDCSLRGDFNFHGQSSICGRCPVFNCTGDNPLLPTEEYRADWAKEWVKFFKKDKYPILLIKVKR